MAESALVVSRALIMSLQNYYMALADAVRASKKPRMNELLNWYMSVEEFTSVVSVADQLRGDVRRECDLAADVWNVAHDFSLASCLLQLVTVVMRCTITITQSNVPHQLQD